VFGGAVGWSPLSLAAPGTLIAARALRLGGRERAPDPVHPVLASMSLDEKLELLRRLREGEVVAASPTPTVEAASPAR
jgi:hypothetical protein